jgi:tetratricopeptide (TPR) repeat protein
MDRWTDNQLDQYQMLHRLQVAALVGVLFIVVYACGFGHGGHLTSIIGVGVVSAGAFLLAGFLAGFVFGIPRTSNNHSTASETAQTPDGKQDASDQASSRLSPVKPNSNLIEISDWLTKIIVGVGLVELNKIPGKLWALAAFIGNGLRDCDSAACKQTSEALALGIIIFFFSTGFLVGYLWTILYLQKTLTDLSLAKRVDSAWALLDLADQAIEDYVKSKAEGDLDRAESLVDRALAKDGRNLKAHLQKAWILKRRAGTPPDKAILRKAVKYAMQAVQIDRRSAPGFYNLACYQCLLGEDRKEVLKNLAKALELDPKLKADAKDDLEKGDLQSCKDDEDFKRLIG